MSASKTNPQTNPPSIAQPLKDDPKPPAALEEDDEFEDFPVDDWPASEQTLPSATTNTATAGAASGPGGAGSGGVSEETANATTHLWEESWDDDDMSEDFSTQLKAELEKVKAGK